MADRTLFPQSAILRRYFREHGYPQLTGATLMVSREEFNAELIQLTEQHPELSDAESKARALFRCATKRLPAPSTPSPTSKRRSSDTSERWLTWLWRIAILALLGLLVLLLSALPAHGMQRRLGVQVQEEGTAIRTQFGGLVQIDCVGAGIVCSVSGNKVLFTVTSGGGGAPTTAEYLVLTLDAGLTAERNFVAGIGIAAVDSGADAPYTISLDLSELVANQVMFDGGQATQTITFSLSGATDPVVSLADGVFNISTGTLQEGGVDAVILTKTQTPTNKTLDAGVATTTHAAGANFLRTLRHATDCTAITDGQYGEICWEQDANRFFMCENAAGCAVPGDWIQDTDSGGNVDLLDGSVHQDTTAGTVVRGDVITGQTAAPTEWTRLAIGTNLQFLGNDGTDALWEQPNFTDLAGTATDAQLPTEIAYEDEANIFTFAGGVTTDNQLGVRLRELTANGTNYIEHRSVADAGAGNTTYTWPVTTDTRVLGSGTSGALTWTQASGVGSCTNQFTRALNNLAAPTCNTVLPGDMDLTANYPWTGQHTFSSAEILGASPFRFEGLTDDNIYTVFTFTDPTVGRSVTFPNADTNTVVPQTCGGTDKFSAVSSAGVFTCDTDQTAGGAFWEAITNSADTATLYTGDNNAETYTLNWTSNWATDRFTVSQGAGNPTAGSLATISYTDPDIDALTISDGTDTLVVGPGMSNILTLQASGAAEIHATEVEINVEKGSAGTITAGQAVYQSGFDAVDGVIEVELADADTAGTMPAIGIAQESITDTTAGHIVAFGTLAGIDTSLFSTGDALYVSGTPGALTATKPTGTALVQKVAQVGRSHVSLGVIEVFGAGRSNDLPNIADDNLWVGSSTGVPTATLLSDCQDTGGNHLNYTQSTNTPACGISVLATTVLTDQSNTYSTGDQSFAAAGSLTVPTAAGAAPTSSGDIRYDSTANEYEGGVNGSNETFIHTASTPSAGDISGSFGAGLTIDAGAVASAELATANKTFKCNFVLFDENGLADTDDIPTVSQCSIPGRAITVNEVRCEYTTGTAPVVQLQKDDGAVTNMLSSNLTCGTDVQGTCGTGCTTAFVSTENNMAANDNLDFLLVTANTSTRISMVITGTVD